MHSDLHLLYNEYEVWLTEWLLHLYTLARSLLFTRGTRDTVACTNVLCRLVYACDSCHSQLNDTDLLQFTELLLNHANCVYTNDIKSQ